MSTSFGIHVGNSCACLAVSKDGKTDVVANPTGDRVTPAMVAFQDTEVIVGLAAKQGRIRNLPNTVVTNKQFLFPGGVTKEILDSSPVTVHQQNEGGYVYEVDFKEKAYKLSPQQILGHILTYVHDIAASHCSDVDQSNCVLTVPLDYTEDQRTAVKTVASKAGFNVVQVISEPVAACLAHGVGQLDLSERFYCLVFRVGGVSTDISLVLVAGGVYTVLDTVSLSDLGGDQMTGVLVQHLAKEFKQKYKEDILTNKRGKAKLAAQAETVKHVLSTLDTAHCYVESLFDGMDFSSNVTRARFDSLLTKVLSDLTSPISSLLSRTNLSPQDVSKVVLAGGSTKVVKLQSALANLFPSAEMLSSLAPDEVNAIGAAVQASFVTRDTLTGLKEKMLAISKNILAVVKGAAEPLLIVCADTPLPVKRSQVLPLPSDSESVTVDICWGAASVVLTQLTLTITSKSKLSLSVHIHRDGGTHVTMTDKTAGTSTDAMLK